MKRNKRRYTYEELELLKNLQHVKDRIDSLYISLERTSNPILIDAFIYELKANNKKYQYYIKICKEKGITMDKVS